MAKSKNTNKEINELNSEEVFEGKVPPYSKELEMNVLGGLIIDNSYIDTVNPILDPKKDQFYINAHNLIYRAICDLHDRNEPVDLITLTEEMKSRGELEKIGGPYIIAELSTSFSSLESIVFSANKIKDNWVKRDLIRLTFEIRELCLDPTSETESLLDKAQHEILDVTNYLHTKNFVHIKDQVKETMPYLESLDERRQKGAWIFGVPSGYDELDALTGGFQQSELIVLAGRPSHGKSALALSIARNAAIEHDKKIGIFSIEMSNQELALRFICMESRVDISKLRTGTLPHSEWEKVGKFSPKLNRANIYIDDSSPLGLLELRAKARRMKAVHDIDMVIVDYLQLMEVSSSRKTDNRYLEIGYITRGLKQLSKELQIPVMALSQLSRKVEDRAGKEKRPQLSDLRESGSIEQDADVVIFINRPELYMSKEEKEKEDVQKEQREATDRYYKYYKGLAEIIVGKQRNGPVGEVDLTFINQYARFENYAKKTEPKHLLPTLEETPF